MNVQTKMPTTADEFLRWNEGREGKREFVRGRVVEMMINVTRNHWRIASRLTQQLRMQLDHTKFDVGSADFGVKTSDGVRFPDVLVEAFDENGNALATTAPLLIIEVLSPSSIADDFGPKARDYFAISSLRHYLTVSQEEKRVWHWLRTDDGAWAKPAIAETGEIVLIIGGETVRLDVPALYAGIVGASS